MRSDNLNDEPVIPELAEEPGGRAAPEAEDHPVGADIVRQYLRQIGKIPVLKAADETEL